MKKTLLTLALILATAALCAAQNHMEFFQTTGTTDTGGYAYIGNTAHAGQWLTAGVWVTTGFWPTRLNCKSTCLTRTPRAPAAGVTAV